MKDYYYQGGEFKMGSTMTVSELIEVLKKYPDDLPVFGEWEGVLGFIEPYCFEVAETDKGGERHKVLSIYVENH